MPLLRARPGQAVTTSKKTQRCVDAGGNNHAPAALAYRARASARATLRRNERARGCQA
jgi:hypothetical protein